MGLITGLFTLPLAPVRGTVWVAEQVKEASEREYYDPANIRRKLEDVAEARDAGEISEEEATALEKELVARLLEAQRRPTQEDAQ